MRKLFTLLLLLTLSVGLWAQEIDAVKFVQGQTTDWYLLASHPEVTFDANHNPVINGMTYDLANGSVETTFGTSTEDTWYTLRQSVTIGNWNTICMEKNITAIDGATFWNVVSETDTEFTLEQVFEPQAGYGYLIRYSATELKVQYGNETATEPVTATQDHPIQGNFAEITCDEHGGNELVGNYVVYQNQLCKVTGWVTMADHRAYVVAQKAPKTAPAIAGGPRMTMAKPNGAPTSLGGKDEGLRGGEAMKVIKDGHFMIIREGKMYNVQGQIIR